MENNIDHYQQGNYVRAKILVTQSGVYRLGPVIGLTESEPEGENDAFSSMRYASISIHRQELLACGLVLCPERSTKHYFVYMLPLPLELQARIGYFEVILDCPDTPLACYDSKEHQVRQPVTGLHALQNLYHLVTGSVLLIDKSILTTHG